MWYSDENLKVINQKYADIVNIHNKLFLELLNLERRLKNHKAREYMMHGVGRRLKTLTRCINNIFTIFPAENTKRLSSEQLADVTINLHAFFINIAGVFDNLAWVFVYENDLYGSAKEGRVERNGVGLFNPKTLEHLNVDLKKYLTSDPIKSWNVDYSKNYRDSLAHRIPLYVPPFVLDKSEAKEFEALQKEIQKLNFRREEDIAKYEELSQKQEKLGKVSLVFSHSFAEGGRPVYFHAQVVADYLTVEDIARKFFNIFPQG